MSARITAVASASSWHVSAATSRAPRPWDVVVSNRRCQPSSSRRICARASTGVGDVDGGRSRSVSATTHSACGHPGPPVQSSRTGGPWAHAAADRASRQPAIERKHVRRWRLHPGERPSQTVFPARRGSGSGLGAAWFVQAPVRRVPDGRRADLHIRTPSLGATGLRTVHPCRSSARRKCASSSPLQLGRGGRRKRTTMALGASLHRHGATRFSGLWGQEDGPKRPS